MKPQIQDFRQNEKSANASNSGMYKPAGLALFLLYLVLPTAMLKAQGTWSALTNYPANYNGGVMLLLSDGSVICKNYYGITNGSGWSKLTPDATGHYLHGTWSSIAPMANDRLYFSTQILTDGRVYVSGGEYGAGGTAGEIYTPVTNTWATLPAIPGSPLISDANSEILPDGKVLQAIQSGTTLQNYIYNPVSNSYTATVSCFGSHDEVAWVKLPDQSILQVDIFSTNTERYIPATNTWIHDAAAPVMLYDPYGYETGAALLLPNGKAFFLGATGHTAIYTPSGTTSPGTWVAGPDIPGGLGCPDAAAAMMVNGNILCAVSPQPTAANHFPGPTSFYEYNYLTNSFIAVSAPGGGTSISQSTYTSNMLDLPDGTVLFSEQGSMQYYIYTPGGTPLTAGKPVINNVTGTSCNTFTITGTNFNGISEGAGYGDDWQMASNYPIIRLTSGTNAWYARSYNWNRTGVMTGTLPDTAQFALPPGLPNGTYSLQVIANGNASSPYTFTTGSAPITPITASVCQGNTTSFTAAITGGVWSSSNSAIASIGVSTGIATGIGTGIATISYALGTCVSTATITVNPSPAAISGANNLCEGSSVTLTDPTTGGVWLSANTAIATVSASGVVSGVATGSTTITYATGSTCYKTMAITVNALPGVFTVTGGGSVCTGGTGVPVGLSGSSTGVNYQLFRSGIMVGTAIAGTGASLSFGLQTVAGTYTVVATKAGTTCISNMTGSATVTVGTTTSISAITGPSTVCTGSVIALSDAAPGGTWSSSNPAVATAGSTSGSVYGVASGTVNIYYSVTSSCGTASVVKVITVNPVPANITGATALCAGATTALSDASTGGAWSSSNPAVATISTIGLVTGVLSGSATISYTLPTTCFKTLVLNINPIPALFSVTGGGSYCPGGSGVAVGLSGSAVGVSYQLFRGGVAVGSVVAGTGAALSFGLQTVAGTYNVVATRSGGACSMNMTGSAIVSTGTSITVSPISGPSGICSGSTIALSDVTPGGIWLSSNTSVTTVGSLTGVVTALSAGSANIYYTVSGSCGSASVVKVITINPTPAAGAISGPSIVGLTHTITLTETVTGGNWSSSNIAVASVCTSGIVTGLSTGIVNIYYTVTNSYSCSSVAVKTVTVSLTGAKMSINPRIELETGAQITINSQLTDGVWTIGDEQIATISPTGQVMGISRGNTTLTYTFINNEGTNIELTDVLVYKTLKAGTNTSSVNSGLSGNSGLQLYPNPNRGDFMISGIAGLGTEEPIKMELTNMLGQVVYKKTISTASGNNNEQVELGDSLPNGVYLVNFYTGNGNKQLRFVIDR